MDNELLRRFFEGTVTEKEKEQVASWLANSENADRVENFLETYWSEISTEEESVPLFDEMFSKAQQKETRTGKLLLLQKTSFWFKMAAACLLFLFLGSLVGYNLKKSPPHANGIAVLTAQTGKGQRAELVLSDGSLVLLKPESKIVFPKDLESNPVLFLEGEAAFEMTKERKPLVIKTKDLVTTSKGAQMVISAFPKDSTVTVSVQEGKAEVRSNQATMPLMNLRIPKKDSSAKASDTSKKVIPLIELRPAIVRDNQLLIFNKKSGTTDINVVAEDHINNEE